MEARGIGRLAALLSNMRLETVVNAGWCRGAGRIHASRAALLPANLYLGAILFRSLCGASSNSAVIWSRSRA